MIWKILGIALAVLIVISLFGALLKAVVGLAILALIVVGGVTVVKWFSSSKTPSHTGP